VKSTCAAEDLKDVSLAALASRSTRAMLSASVFNSRACLLMCVVCVCKPRCMSALDLLTLSTFLCTLSTFSATPSAWVLKRDSSFCALAVSADTCFFMSLQAPDACKDLTLL